MKAHTSSPGDMMPQDFCSLPWCGQSFGAPYKRVKIDGIIHEYPERIDAHHAGGQKRPPIIYICHSCHMDHHDGRRRLEFEQRHGQLAVRNGDYWLSLAVTPCT